MQNITEAPEWFSKAIGVAYEEHWTEVDGCSIHYQYWGNRDAEMSGMDKPGILFVHGNGAHSHWWDFVAPGFLNDYRVAAMDLSGMGDSGHRGQYSAQLFAEEVMCVAADAGFSNNTILVGHSFGGSIARLAARIHGSRVQGLVLVDSALGPARGRVRAPPGLAQRASGQRERPPRSYATLEAACKRFKLRPHQPCANRYIVKYIAEHSVRKGSAGWQWKLDQMVFAKMIHNHPAASRNPMEMISELKCPVSLIYGRNSRFFPAEMVAALEEIIAPENLVAIEDAHHHLFLDQPLQFVSKLQRLLKNWRL
jgi:pimeloyl-ACP methyl ester carboxylesterase